MTQTKERKRFKDLNLLDRFLFAEAMEDQQNMELLLDIILDQETHLQHPPQTEKERRWTNEDRQVRLDVYALDEEFYAEGAEQVSDLYGKLMELNRMEDMKRAVKDNVYREKLLLEFGFK